MPKGIYPRTKFHKMICLENLGRYAQKGNRLPEEIRLKVIKTLRPYPKGRKNPKQSEIRKKLFNEGKIKIWSKGKHIWKNRKHPKGMLGKHHSEKQKEIARKKGFENNPMKNPEIAKKVSEKMKGFHPITEFKNREQNPAWRGGISLENYPLEFNKILKEMIRQRDNFTCKICNMKQNGKKLSIHHIDYNKENINSNNLISLCKNCYVKTNQNRNYWTEYFRGKIPC